MYKIDNIKELVLVKCHVSQTFWFARDDENRFKVSSHWAAKKKGKWLMGRKQGVCMVWRSESVLSFISQNTLLAYDISLIQTGERLQA